MRIGNIEITGRAALAPMAGVTDAAYRRLCAQFGAAYTVTEMVSAKAIQYSYEKTSQLADTSGDERPVFLQLFGSDPFDFGLAARKAAAFGPGGIRSTKTPWRWPRPARRPGPPPSLFTAGPGTRCTWAAPIGTSSAR